jgi:NTE family protein
MAVSLTVAGILLAAHPLRASDASAPAPGQSPGTRAPSGSGGASPAPAPVAAQPAARPRIGLALGGGAARGFAHIGLLRWLEEHRIPVDYIAGTSMGGLVGGAYASGMSPDEIQAILKETDWDLMFLADSPFKYKTFRRKEDARAFPGQIDFGLKGGFTLPSGLNAGQQIELLLDRIALPYYELRSFDDLPTPFRAVSADLRTAEPMVFDSDSLARALRATMALPAVFTPVAFDGRVLVDGGVLNNVPADVVKAMGADVAIAVNVSSSTDQTVVPTTLFNILGQTLDSMMVSATRQSLKSADLLIVPDLKGLTATDWRRLDDLVTRGYEAGAAMSDQLLKYQMDDTAYAAWMAARLARRRTTTPPVNRVVVEGLPPVETENLTAELQARHGGRSFSREDVEDSLLRIAGSDRYEILAYTLRAGAQGPDLVVRATPKSYGPPFLLPALDIQNIDSSSFALSLRVRLAAYDTPLPNSELRLDGAVGTNQLASVEFYKRVGHRGWFFAPRGYFVRNSFHAYEEGERIADYRVKRTGAGIDIGHTTGLRSELRVGYDVADVRARLEVGLPRLPEVKGQDEYMSVRWVFDGQNSPLVPSSGVRIRSALRYYFDTAVIVDSEGTPLQHNRDVPQAEASATWFRRVWSKQRLFLGGGAGTSFGSDPGFNQFRLGGPLRLGAFNNDEILGDHYLLGVVGLLHEWFRLPDVLGGNAYVGAWFEQGSAFNSWDEAAYTASASIFGPAFIGYSQSPTSGDGRFYLALAPLWP